MSQGKQRGARAPKKTSRSRSGAETQAQKDFRIVVHLVKADDAKALKKELARMRSAEPARYRAMTAYACRIFKGGIGDKPCTVREANSLVAKLCAITGWSRARVICEAMFLFLDQCPIVWRKSGGYHVLPKDYKAGTPKDDPAWRERPTFEQVLDEVRAIVNDNKVWLGVIEKAVK